MVIMTSFDDDADFHDITMMIMMVEATWEWNISLSLSFAHGGIICWL